jgi:hypothetical protein
MADQTYYIAGVNVGVQTNTQLVIEPFSLYMFGINQIVDIPTTVFPDLTTIGLNGMDANPNGSGNMPPDWAYNIFVLYSSSEGSCSTTSPCLGFIITKATAISNVVLPSGWTVANTSYRKLSYGIVVTGGILLTNHTTHWPMPRVDFTTQLLLESFTTSQSFTAVDVAKFAPDNSRFVNFRAVLTGTGNNLWLSPTGGTQYQKLFAYNEQGVKNNLWMRVQYTYGSPSTSLVYVTFQPGASGRVDLYIDGFAMTEVD